MKIEVDWNSILTGVIGQPQHCFLAKAISRVKGVKKVFVASANVAATIRGKRMYADLPRSARRFQRKFDAGKSVEPFNFRLNFKECE